MQSGPEEEKEKSEKIVRFMFGIAPEKQSRRGTLIALD